MSVLAVLVAVVLVVIGALHFYWGVGGLWPQKNETTLTEHVVGISGPMPGLIPSVIVAALLVGAAWTILIPHGAPRLFIPIWLWGVGYWIVIGVFALRGAATYVAPIFRYAEGTPFYKLNRTIYSPLCLAIASALVLDWVMRRP